MSLLAINLCKRLRYRLSNEISSTIIRRYNGAMFEEQVKPDKSKLFPDYDVIYVYPKIHLHYTCNKTKRNFTVLAISAIPITGILQMLGYMSMSDCINFTCCVVMILLPLHTICYYCNNVVGSIYYKEGETKVIISYLNYWGKRIDLTVDKDNIIPFMEIPYNTPRNSFMRLKIASVKPTLKVFVKNAYISTASIFHNIFGNFK